jgi:prophage tail gpP-like protein
MYYNVSIKEIALDNSFLFVKNEPNEIYKTVEIDSGDNAFSKFSKLALDRGMYAIPNYDGSLLFADITRLTNLNYTIEDGDQNVLGISASYDITTRFAKYIGFDKNSSVTINDSSIDNRRGQKYIRTNDITSDKTKIAKMARSKNIANSFTMAVSLSTWELNKTLLQPGMLINVNSPMNMIYQKSEFVIKQIDYTYDINNGYICEIQLTLPEAYTNNEPNPRFFGTYEEKEINSFTKFTKIPDSKDVYDSARKIKL